MTVRKPLLTEFGGIKVGDQVRITCPAAPTGNMGIVETVKKEPNTGKVCFRVLLKRGEPREGLGSWWPIWPNELVKL